MEDSNTDASDGGNPREVAEHCATELETAFEEVVEELDQCGQISDATYRRAVFALRAGKNVVQNSKN